MSEDEAGDFGVLRRQRADTSHGHGSRVLREAGHLEAEAPA
jgi:hypothetical protein